MKKANTKEIENTRMKKGQYQTLKKGLLKTALLFSLPLSVVLAEYDGFYMGIGYQIGAAQQSVNNEGSTLRNNVINDFRQVGVDIAGGNGLLRVASNTMMNALLGLGDQIISDDNAGNTSNTQLTKFKQLLPQIKQRYEADKNAYTIQALQLYLNDLLYNLVTSNTSGNNNSKIGAVYAKTITTLHEAQSNFNLLATASVGLLNALTRVSINSDSAFLNGLLERMQLFNATSAEELGTIATSLNKSGATGVALQTDVQAIMNQIRAYQGNLQQLKDSLNGYNEPYLPQFGSGKSSQHGVSNGIGVQMGYKQFFGGKKNVGLRYYAFFDYGFTQLGNLNSTINANIFTYGAGTDFLWNIFRRVFSDQSLHIGVFGGIQLAGTTWDSSLKNQIQNSFQKKPTPTNFQFLFNLGLRAHFASTMHRRFLSASQSVQHGVEFGVKIPTINQKYLRANGADVDYRRLYAFYINYTIGF
ncbi:outer membrane protein [Helicobacter acinonychis]|uniref:Outer membrane protein 26 n=2 Tax=Helicobacter acinonychis TaxID=212 RepID=Q17W84_HELAH|nr:outer membrane protein [Helicobacter acinonychis]CAK00092.1 outer membrane protein 26 [Helicobacter acinonychis str. Sheeba]SFZ70798.1 OMP1264 [Helicobacter acinonychis]